MKKQTTTKTAVVDRVGFTGTRQGMTEPQRRTVTRLLNTLKPREVHHGCCHGADRDFHALVIGSRAGIHLWPSDSLDQANWAAIHQHEAVKVHAAARPLDRDLSIVANSDVMIACPPTHEEIIRSGTWTTIRITRRRKVMTYIVWPDGTFKLEQYRKEVNV